MTRTVHWHRHPVETLERCSLRADLRGDPMLGTAFPAARLLLVEQPGPWGHDALATSNFDRALALRLVAKAGRAGIRVIVIRRPGRTRSTARRSWALVDCRVGHELARWGVFDDDHELLDLPLDGSAGVADARVAMLVCTHSKHDACCAVRGRPVAAALAAVRPDQVWECSHVGGERFAANVLVLPLGLLYGRVLPLAAPEFIAAAERGEVVGALLRGRIGLPPAAQAALAYAYEHLAVRDVAALRVVRTGPTLAGLAVVELSSPRGGIEVAVRIERIAAEGLTCTNPGPNAYMSYRPVSLSPID